MCVVSMVYDHYYPRFPNNPIEILPAQVPDLQKMLQDFQEALEAAKKVDILTGQPDCEDPEKAKLLDRVALLEKRVEELEGTPKKKAKKRKKT